MTYSDMRECAYEFCDIEFLPNTHNHVYCCTRHKDAQARINDLEGHTQDFARKYYNEFIDTKHWERREAALLREIDKERSKTAAILELVERHNPTAYDPVSFVMSGEDAAILHLTLADLQTGKFANGKGIKQLKKYLEEYLNRILEIVDGQNLYYVNQIVVHLLGDILENCGMFGSQAFELDYENGGHLVVKQVLISADLIEWFIRQLYRLDIPIRVTSVPGNHGRRFPLKGGETVSAPDDNFDTMIGLLVKKYCNDLDIEWDIAEDTWFTKTDSLGWRFVTMHGHQISGQTNTAFEKFFTNHETSGTWGKADVILLGHRHHPMTLTIASDVTVIQSGALDGGSPWYHEKTGKGLTSPSQEVMFVTKNGLVQRHTIQFGKIKPRRKK